MLKTLLSFLPPPYSLSRLFTLLIFLSGKQALMMVISLEIMAMFRKVEEESRGLELFFSDLACSLSSWMGTIASGIGTLFLTLRFPVSSQLVCEQAARSRRTLCSWSVCLICWVHRWAQVMCTGALGKNTGRHCCVYSHFFHHFEVSEFGCIAGSYFDLCVFFFSFSGWGSLLLRIFGLHLLFFSGSFASIIGLGSDKELLHLERFYSFYHLLLK